MLVDKNRSDGSLQNLFGELEGIALAVLVTVIAFIILNYFNIFQLDLLVPSFSIFPHLPRNTSVQKAAQKTIFPPDTNAFVETCPVKQTNALVGTILQTDGGTVGNLIGNVENISYDPASKTAVIDLISKNAAQKHIFTITDHDGLVADGTTQAPLHLSDIKYSQGLALSFECDNSHNNIFTITQIALIKK